MAFRSLKQIFQHLHAGFFTKNLLTCVEDAEVTNFSNAIVSSSCLLNTLETLDYLSFSSYSNTREDKISKLAGVGNFGDVTKNDCNCCAAHSSMTEKGRSRISTIDAPRLKKGYVLLAVATLLATVTFTAACGFPRLITNANNIYDNDTGRIVQGKRESIITSSFILLNSTGFIVSLAIVISFLRSFPLKPLPQISVFMFYGSYMCLIMKISPWECWLVLFLSVPLLLLAAAGKLSNFAE